MIQVVSMADGRYVVPLARPYDGMGVLLENGVLGFVGASDDAMSLIFQVDPDVTISDLPYEHGRHNRRHVIDGLLGQLWRRGYVDADTAEVPFELVAG